MKTHIDAVKLLLTGLGCPVAYVDAHGISAYPYVLLWSSAGQPGIESAVSADSDLSDLIGVTWVDTTPANALTLAAAGRALLAATRPTVTGRAVWLALESSEPAAVDRDITLPDTNRHPAYVVDRYRLISTAA